MIEQLYHPIHTIHIYKHNFTLIYSIEIIFISFSIFRLNFFHKFHVSMNIKFSNYSIDLIKDFINNKLFLKLKRLEILSIRDLIELDVDFFKDQKGVGENATNQLIQLKEYIEKNKGRVLKYVQEKTEIKTIPKEYSELNFLVQISSIVKTYCSFFKKRTSKYY